MWYETSFIVEATDCVNAAAYSLGLSFECNLGEALAINEFWSRLAEVPFGKGLDDYSLNLAKGISIGSFEDAEALGNLILHSRKKPGWFTSDGNGVTNFILALFSKWQGLDWSEYRLRSRYSFYQALIDNVFEHAADVIAEHLYEACDFHIDRSRNLNETDRPEFDRPFARVYPSEILAVLSLRRKAGLANPTIDHLLLKLPTSLDFAVTKADDSLLATAKKRLINTYELRER
jgi:hypothetical protein